MISFAPNRILSALSAMNKKCVRHTRFIILFALIIAWLGCIERSQYFRINDGVILTKYGCLGVDFMTMEEPGLSQQLEPAKTPAYPIEIIIRSSGCFWRNCLYKSHPSTAWTYVYSAAKIYTEGFRQHPVKRKDWELFVHRATTQTDFELFTFVSEQHASR